MKQLKIGDWVRDSLDFNSIHQIKEIKDGYIETYSKDFPFFSVTRMLYLTDGTEHLRIIGSSFVFKPEKIAYTTFLRGKSSIPLAILNDAIIEGEQKIFFLEECEVWKPKEDEWCWFWNSSLGIWFISTLKDFGEYNNLVQYRCNSVYYICEKCEPFIGELPSFLKDKR